MKGPGPNQRRLEWLARQFGQPKGWFGRWILGRWLDRISRPMNWLALEQLAPGPGEHILEVGFGGGALLQAIMAAGPARTVGIDWSRAMVEGAKRRFRPAIVSGRLALHQGSVEALKLEAASFDKAVSVNSLYFWPKPGAAFAELARVIRPGGRLVLCFEPPEELRKWPGHAFGFRLYESEEVARLAEAAGFGNVRAEWGTGRKPDRFLCLSLERLGDNPG